MQINKYQPSVFSAAYWRAAADELKNIRVLAFAGRVDRTVVVDVPVLSGLIYGVLLYRRPVSIPRLIVLRLLINFGNNVALGSVWKAMLYGKGYLYYFTTGLVKNAVLLPLEVFLMWMVLRAADRWALDKKYLHSRRGS